MPPKERSAVAEMENWKVRTRQGGRGVELLERVRWREERKAAVIKEQQVASAFEENWGYLKARPEDLKVLSNLLCFSDIVVAQPRAFETRVVKYFDHGVASVKEKRIALQDEDRENAADNSTAFSMSQHKTSMYRTTSSIYGSRNTLEMFGKKQSCQVRALTLWTGVAQHGLKSDITKVLF
eukprot:748309-Hanusia_phi.AAC.15